MMSVSGLINYNVEKGKKKCMIINFQLNLLYLRLNFFYLSICYFFLVY